MEQRSRQLNPLIGRAYECDDLSALLERGDSQLITITGPGGIGKTRLALDIVGRLAIPTIFVGFESIHDPGLVLPALADALGIPTRIGQEVREEIGRFLQNRELVLVLDNLEHLAGIEETVAWVIGLGAGIRVLTTSRSPLHVEAERVFALGPLSVGDDAVELFISRAELLDRTFVADERTRVDIAAIGQLLDGLPLAIELAAARVHAISPAALRSMLEAKVALPEVAHGGRPERHRTLDTTIAWSFDLLASNQRELFANVSLFVGGFSLQEAVGLAREQMDDAATLLTLNDLLELVDASLLLPDGGDDEPRFRMLSTVRTFGLDRLSDRSDAQAVMMRHAQQFLDLAEASVPAMRGAERSQWLNRLDLARANLRSALDRLIGWNETELALRMVAALWPYWWWRSHVIEGQTYLRVVLAMPAVDRFPSLAGRCLVGLGALAETMGRYADADDAHHAAEQLLERIGDKQGLAESCLFRWLVSFNAEDLAGMTTWSDRSLNMFREVGDRWGIAMSLMQKGVMAMRQREHDAATDVLTESSQLFRMLPDAWGVAICQGVQSNVESDRRAYARAIELQRASLGALLSLNDLWGVVMVMPAAVRLAADLGQVELAVRLAGATEALSSGLGTPIKEPFRERFATAMNQARSGLGKERFDQLWAEGEALSPEHAVELAGTIMVGNEVVSGATVPGPMVALSPREREVVRLIPTHSARTIGEQLFISESTVRTHIDNILAKFGARNQKELIAMLYQQSTT